MKDNFIKSLPFSDLTDREKYIIDLFFSKKHSNTVLKKDIVVYNKMSFDVLKKDCVYFLPGAIEQYGIYNGRLNEFTVKSGIQKHNNPFRVYVYRKVKKSNTIWFNNKIYDVKDDFDTYFITSTGTKIIKPKYYSYVVELTEKQYFQFVLEKHVTF